MQCMCCPSPWPRRASDSSSSSTGGLTRFCEEGPSLPTQAATVQVLGTGGGSCGGGEDGTGPKRFAFARQGEGAPNGNTFDGTAIGDLGLSGDVDASAVVLARFAGTQFLALGGGHNNKSKFGRKSFKLKAPAFGPISALILRGGGDELTPSSGCSQASAIQWSKAGRSICRPRVPASVIPSQAFFSWRT